MGFLSAAFFVSMAGFAGAQTGQSAGPSPTMVKLKNQKGQDAGTVALTQFPAGVLIRGELTDLPPGWHAIHVHEKGVCEGTFESAGGHLSAPGEGHGLDQPRHHAGDLPNIWVGNDGTAKFEMVATRFALGDARVAGAGQAANASGSTNGAAAGAAIQALDSDGAAIVVHSHRDDYRSDPAGDSHERIACGVLR
jgi:Cu-Zn family superoxide dismutase